VKHGGRSSIWTCGSCGKRVEAYEPPGWRYTLFLTEVLNGKPGTKSEAKEEGHMCSETCERKFFRQQLQRLLEEENDLTEPAEEAAVVQPQQLNKGNAE
jgi:transcription elongation factor Elf1